MLNSSGEASDFRVGARVRVRVSPVARLACPYASENVTGGRSFISSTKSFFGISYRQLPMPKT